MTFYNNLFDTKPPKNPTKDSTDHNSKSQKIPVKTKTNQKVLKNYIPYEFQPLEFH